VAKPNKAQQKAADAKKAARQARDADHAKQVSKLARMIGLGKKGK
jgi:hypothetical protein